MGKKTSSVEWLFNEIAMPEYGEPPKWVMDILQQAKEMFQGEIEEAHIAGQCSWKSGDETANEYYNETFKG